MSRLSQIIEAARRKSLQVPGQIEIPDDDKTIADIEDDELWQEHTRERMAGMRRVDADTTWATEDEALQEWRDRTFHPIDLRYLFGARLDRC